jgi:hypothetical protein
MNGMAVSEWILGKLEGPELVGDQRLLRIECHCGAKSRVVAIRVTEDAFRVVVNNATAEGPDFLLKRLIEIFVYDSLRLDPADATLGKAQIGELYRSYERELLQDREDSRMES